MPDCQKAGWQETTLLEATANSVGSHLLCQLPPVLKQDACTKLLPLGMLAVLAAYLNLITMFVLQRRPS